MAILDRKTNSDDPQIAEQHEIEQPFAEIDAKKLDHARRDPKIQNVLAAADEHMATLRAENRID